MLNLLNHQSDRIIEPTIIDLSSWNVTQNSAKDMEAMIKIWDDNTPFAPLAETGK